MRTRKLYSGIAAIACLSLAVGACGSAKKAGPAIFLSIVGPANESSIKGNVVRLDMGVEGIAITKADGDTTGKTGHFHVFIDREPVAAGQTIPKEPGIVHAATNPIVIPGLAIGTHTFKVVLGNGAHVRIGNWMTQRKLTITGPSLDATAPASVAAGGDVILQAKVEGVTLSPASTDTGAAGTTGHIHVFIDRDPTPSGQAIPKESGIIHTADSTVTIPGLAPGEHTFWVVLGTKAHLPFDPLVADKVTVTVG